jgi:hypothetical protein
MDYEQCLEAEYEKALSMHRDKTHMCMDYLKVVEMYSKLIGRSQTLEEAKYWADKMMDHALRVE